MMEKVFILLGKKSPSHFNGRIWKNGFQWKFVVAYFEDLWTFHVC